MALTPAARLRAKHFRSLAELQKELIGLANPINPSGNIGVPTFNGVSIAPIQEGEHRGETVNGGHDYPLYPEANPTLAALGEIYCAIEGGKRAFPMDDGRMALSAIFKLLPHGSRIIFAPSDFYPGDYGLIEELKFHSNITVDIVKDTRPETLRSAMRKNTHMIFCEVLTNPLLQISNLRNVTEFARENNLISVVDNTCTPFAIRPFDFGIDLVAHSLTKHLSGDGDSYGGVVLVSPTSPRADEFIGRLDHICCAHGYKMTPETAHKLITDAPRVMAETFQRYATAEKIALQLAAHPAVAKVLHPALPEHPQHDLFLQDLHACGGGLVTFILKGGPQAIDAFFRASEITQASSLGMAITVLYDFARQSKSIRAMSVEDRRKKLGYEPGMVRMAVGLEQPGTLKRQVSRGLAACPG